MTESGIKRVYEQRGAVKCLASKKYVVAVMEASKYIVLCTLRASYVRLLSPYLQPK